MFILLATASLAKTDEKKCRPGWELHGELCRKWDSNQLVPWCEKGDLENGLCVVEFQPYGSCIEDGYLNEGMCENYHVESPITFCPDGFDMNLSGKKSNSCIKTETVKVMEDCPLGTVEVSARECLSYDMFDEEFTCPKGKYLEGQSCISHELYDCDVPSFPHGVSKKYPKSKSHHRMLGAKKHDDNEHLYVEDMHSIEDVIVEQVCERAVHSPAIGRCPEGSYRAGKVCKAPKYHKRHLIERVVSKRAPIESACPQPYEWCDSKKKKLEGSCCAVELQDPVWECPSGTIMTKSGCFGKFEPEFVCADSSKKKGKHGADCSEWLYEEPEVIIFTQLEAKKKKHNGHH